LLSMMKIEAAPQHKYEIDFPKNPYTLEKSPDIDPRRTPFGKLF